MEMPLKQLMKRAHALAQPYAQVSAEKRKELAAAKRDLLRDG